MPEFKQPIDLDTERRKKQRKQSKTPADYAKELQRETEQDARQEIATIESRFGPPTFTEPRCSICTSPYRVFIETLLVHGHTKVSIAERVPGKDGSRLDRRSIANHADKHMSFRDAAMRELIEEQASLDGKNHQDGIDNIRTHRAMLEVAAVKGFEDILNDVVTVEPRDLIAIVKLRAEMDANSYQTGLEEYRIQVATFMQAIKDETDLDTQAAIARRVKELRQREGMETAIEEALIPPLIESGEEVVEAELIE